ncbi:MAG: DUF2339 domain-containing protein, partial [Gemmatimonadales bacterium]
LAIEQLKNAAELQPNFGTVHASLGRAYLGKGLNEEALTSLRKSADLEFAIGATWGYEYYRPELFASTEPFLVLFFLYYVGVSVLFARRQEVELRGVVDGTLVFGTPIIAFALQAALVQDMSFGLAFSALGAAATYVLLALWLKRQDAFSDLLGQSFVALGVVFATLAIPFAFDNQRFTGRHGLVTDLLADQLPWADQLFACGPNAMFGSMSGVLREAGTRKPVQALLEERMGCGTGVCYGCAVFARRGVKLVCKDGPRFELRDVFPY